MRTLNSKTRKVIMAAATIFIIVVCGYFFWPKKLGTNEDFLISQQQQMYYRLHQSLGFYEMFIKDKCPGGLQKAKGYLVMKYDRNQSRDLWEVMRKMMLMISSNEKPPESAIANLRNELRTIQKNRGLQHEDGWSLEFENCILR